MKKILKFFLITIIFIGAARNGYAQKEKQEKADSMLLDLSKAKEDTNKVWLLCELANYFLQKNSLEIMKYARQANELAEKLKWEKGMVRSYGCLGCAYQLQNNNQEALKWFFLALKGWEKTGNKMRIFQMNNNIVIAYNAMGDFPMALEYSFKMLKTEENNGNKIGMARVNNLISQEYFRISDYTKSIEYLLKALEIYEKLQPPDEASELDVMSNLAVAYQRLNYPEALDFSNKTLQKAEQMGNKETEANMNANIGSIYTHKRNYSLAVSYCLKSLEISKAINDTNLTATEMYGIGDAVLLMIEDTTKGGTMENRSNEFPEGKPVKNGFIPAGNQARLGLSLNYLCRALQLKDKIEDPTIVEYLYNDLSVAYRLKGNFREALKCHLRYIVLKDSLSSMQSALRMEKVQMEFDFDKRQAAEKAEQDKKELLTANALLKQKREKQVLIGGLLLVLLFAGFVVRSLRISRRQKAVIEAEKQKSEELLLNILPVEIATELKTHGATTAKYFDNVTVLFSDFVNFTEAGERRTPKALVDELHTCFRAFDEITTKYNIEKIKTIGDAYLAVCGLPLADPKHAENVVCAAIEINAFMQDRLTKLGNSTFEIRIGIHSGSVVAGIVGVKKFAYDIWGDAVNTAARMEQNSEAGKINISQTTYELVKDQFNCEFRGEIEVKGKGAMKMYYVNS